MGCPLCARLHICSLSLVPGSSAVWHQQLIRLLACLDGMLLYSVVTLVRIHKLYYAVSKIIVEALDF